MRAETGPMQFGDDWKGVFIRGDQALMLYAPMLSAALDLLPVGPEAQLMRGTIGGLVQLLRDANQHSARDVQSMKPYEQCVDPGPERGGPNDR